MLRFMAPAILMIASVGCMPQNRVNSSCEWRNDPVRLAAPGTRERRQHLAEDVRVAQDLGIRHGDSVGGRLWHAPSLQARAACTEASFQQIMRQHHVSREELIAVTGARDPLIDLLLVILPTALLFAIASHATVRRVVAGLDANRKIVLIVLACITPLAAFLGVGFAQIWGVVVEEARLRSNHISYRAAYIPLYVYKEAAWLIAGALFAGVSARVLRERRAPS